MRRAGCAHMARIERRRRRTCRFSIRSLTMPTRPARSTRASMRCRRPCRKAAPGQSKFLPRSDQSIFGDWVAVGHRRAEARPTGGFRAFCRFLRRAAPARRGAVERGTDCDTRPPTRGQGAVIARSAAPVGAGRRCPARAPGRVYALPGLSVVAPLPAITGAALANAPGGAIVEPDAVERSGFVSCPTPSARCANAPSRPRRGRACIIWFPG